MLTNPEYNIVLTYCFNHLSLEVSVTNYAVPDSDSDNWHIIYSAACSSAEAQRDMLMYCFYWPPFTRMEITSE